MSLAPEPNGGPRDSSAAAPSPRPQASLRAVGLVSLLTGLQLAIQFAIQVVMARKFGAGSEVDAYVAALAPPTVISTILSGSLAYVLVPVISEALARRDQTAAATIVRQIGGGLIVLSLAAMGLVALLAGPFTAALNPGFPPSQQELAAELLQVLSLLIAANSLISLLNALYHAWSRFLAPALAGVVGTLVTLGYMILLAPQQGIFAIAYGVVLGAAVSVAMLLPLFIEQLLRGGTLVEGVHPATRRALALLAPLVLGAIYWRLDPLLDRYLGSYLESGSIAHLGYAWRLVSGLMLIATSGLSIVAFPAIAAHAAAGRNDALAGELAHALRFFLFLMVPVCVGMSVFAIPVVRLLFEQGRFAVGDTEAVALLVVLYAGVILGAGLGDLFSRTSYALHDMRTPVIISAIAFTIAAVLKVLVVGRWGIAGIVAATSFYSLLNVVILGAIIVPRVSPAALRGTLGTTIRALVASAVACLAAAAVMLLLQSRLAVLPAAAAGAVVYFAAMWMMHDEFARRIHRWLLRKPRR